MYDNVAIEITYTHTHTLHKALHLKTNLATPSLKHVALQEIQLIETI